MQESCIGVQLVADEGDAGTYVLRWEIDDLHEKTARNLGFLAVLKLAVINACP